MLYMTCKCKEVDGKKGQKWKKSVWGITLKINFHTHQADC